VICLVSSGLWLHVRWLYSGILLCDPEKSVSIPLEFVLFTSPWMGDFCWRFIKVFFAVLVLIHNVGLGELGSRSLLPVVWWTYRFGALFWLSSMLVGVSQLPGLRLVVFFASQKAVTRLGTDEGP